MQAGIEISTSQILTPLTELQTRYGGSYGNVINYLVNLAERHLPSQLIAENVLTAIAEHVIADAIGSYSYSGEWVNGSLVISGTPIEPYLIESVENEHQQIPAFEIPRNEANWEFYRKLRQARNEGSRATFVEFSPSPDLDDPEVLKRGYQGNDALFFYSLDEDGNEQITQHWFPAADLYNYAQLFIALGIEIPNPLTDASIMLESGGFNALQFQSVMNFLEERKLIFRSPELQSQILGLKNDYFSNKVTTDLLPRMAVFMDNYTSGRMNELDFAHGLDQIKKEMDEMQFEYRLILRDVMQINTFSKSMSTKIENNGINYLSYYTMDAQSKKHLVTQIGYQGTGCGFGASGGISTNLLYGRSTSLMSAQDKELYEFICPNCKRKHDIDVPNGKYVESCDCGFNARC